MQAVLSSDLFASRPSMADSTLLRVVQYLQTSQVANNKEQVAYLDSEGRGGDSYVWFSVTAMPKNALGAIFSTGSLYSGDQLNVRLRTKEVHQIRDETITCAGDEQIINIDCDRQLMAVPGEIENTRVILIRSHSKFILQWRR